MKYRIDLSEKFHVGDLVVIHDVLGEIWSDEVMGSLIVICSIESDKIHCYSSIIIDSRKVDLLTIYSSEIHTVKLIQRCIDAL